MIILRIFLVLSFSEGVVCVCWQGEGRGVLKSERKKANKNINFINFVT